jgi:hypothetical protein
MEMVYNFSVLPDAQKPISFRNKTKMDLFAFFKKLNCQLKRIIEGYFSERVISVCEDSHDNKVGSDLYVSTTNSRELNVHHVELKFGSETNRNIGNKSMDQIFTVEEGRNSFAEMFREVREKQKKFMSNNPNKIDLGYKHLYDLLKEVSDALSSLKRDGKFTVNSSMMRVLLTTTGSFDTHEYLDDLLKIRVDYSTEILDSLKIMDQPNISGLWEVEKIGMAENSIRVEIKTKNAFISTKFLLNWKNDYTYLGIKYPAKLGLGSSSWNVWIFL